MKLLEVTTKPMKYLDWQKHVSRSGYDLDIAQKEGKVVALRDGKVISTFIYDTENAVTDDTLGMVREALLPSKPNSTGKTRRFPIPGTQKHDDKKNDYKRKPKHPGKVFEEDVVKKLENTAIEKIVDDAEFCATAHADCEKLSRSKQRRVVEVTTDDHGNPVVKVEFGHGQSMYDAWITYDNKGENVIDVDVEKNKNAFRR